MQNLRPFLGLIDRQTLIVTVLAMASTWVCLRIGLVIDMPLELVGIAIVFPIVFSISGAFQRREAALVELAELKANLVAVYLAHRDWPGNGNVEHTRRIGDITRRLYSVVQSGLQEPEGDGLREAYAAFSEISESHEILRREGAVAASDVARVNQYLKHAMMNFEKMRNIAVYRTPRSLRAYTQVFLNSFPILFGPYFAFISINSYPAVGYFVAVLYSLVLVSLDNIQEDLENPYDGIGIDDIDFAESGRPAPLDRTIPSSLQIDSQEGLPNGSP
jgi:hypothetical protein